MIQVQKKVKINKDLMRAGTLAVVGLKSLENDVEYMDAILVFNRPEFTLTIMNSEEGWWILNGTKDERLGMDEFLSVISTLKVHFPYTLSFDHNPGSPTFVFECKHVEMRQTIETYHRNVMVKLGVKQ